MAFRHFLAGLNDGGNVLNWRTAQEFQGQMDVFGAAIVDVFLVWQVFLQLFDHGGIFRAGRDVDG